MGPTRRARSSAVTGIPRTLAWGVALAFGTALISGLSVYLNAFAVRQVPDPAVFTTLKNAVAAGLLVALVLASGGGTVPRLRPRQWTGLVAVGLVGGSVPFVLFFTGLAQASASSAAFIHKTLFIWVAILAVPLLRERLGSLQFAALAVLLAGQAIVQPPVGVAWGPGETLIALATLLWSVEVILAKRLLASSIGPSVLGAGRLGFGLVFLAGYLAVTGKLGDILALGLIQWAWVLVTGALLFGYVATWFAALQRAPATVVTSVLVVSVVITSALQSATAGTIPDPVVIGGYLLIVAAVVALSWVALRRSDLPLIEGRYAARGRTSSAAP